jgi:hypothetical protein
MLQKPCNCEKVVRHELNRGHLIELYYHCFVLSSKPKALGANGPGSQEGVSVVFWFLVLVFPISLPDFSLVEYSLALV